jgi:hypothetical protein
VGHRRRAWGWGFTARLQTSRSADERTWEDALETALGESDQVLRATWESLPVNEQRMALAPANFGASPYEERAYRAVGLKRGSLEAALDGLTDRAEVTAQGV